MHTEDRKTATESAGYAAGVGIGMFREMFRGKHVSAAIITASGALLLLGGSFIAHTETGAFVQVVGVLAGTVGLVGWVFSSSED